jgi:hypothetical protein
VQHWRTVRRSSASQPVTEAIGYTWDQSAVPRDVPRFSVERAVWRAYREGDLIAYGFTLMVFLDRLEALPET